MESDAQIRQENVKRLEARFKDRIREVKNLTEFLESPRFEFIILYGRRRIGKTALALFVARNKPFIYYFAKESPVNSSQNLLDFYQVCASRFPELQKFKPDYKILIEFLQDKVTVIIFDEVQHMVKEDPKLPGIFAECFDQLRLYQKHPLKILMLGSSISLIKEDLLRDPSPLYGRKTWDLKLQAINVFDLRSFFPGATLEEIIEIYGFADGIPYYLEDIQLPFWNWLGRQFRDGKFPMNEIEWLLKMEFREQSRYLAILEAIAAGNTTNKAILDRVFKEPTPSSNLTRYLEKLLTVDFIKKEFPVLDNPLKSRLGRYYLSDNFLKFWFRFVVPNRSGIQAGIFNINIIKAQYSAYLGHIFEEVVRQYLIRNPLIPFSTIGRWWGKSQSETAEEIDLVAFDDSTQDVLLVECKWQSDVVPAEICQVLSEKATNLQFKRTTPSKIFVFAIFAKTFRKKMTTYQGTRVICVDLAKMNEETSTKT